MAHVTGIEQTTTTTLFDDHDMDQGPDPGVRRAVRRAVLGGVLHLIRAARGWNVNDAASQAGMAPMTWRRLEDGLDVRRRSLAAVDHLLDEPLGTAQRALDDDLLMLSLAGKHGVDVTAAGPIGAADFLDQLAERFRTGTVSSSPARPAGERWPVVDDAHRRALDAMAHHVPALAPTPLDHARALIRALDGTTEPLLQELCRVACKALPDLMALELHQAEAEMAEREEATTS